MGALSLIAEGGVATLVIEGDGTGNAIDLEVIRAMHLALDDIQKCDSGTRAIVVTGRGNVFCSGVDLHSVDLSCAQARQRTHAEMRRFMDPLVQRLGDFRCPIVAAVNGAATGAGMSLAIACDIVVASEDAYFLPSFTRLGLVPDAGITFHLARRIGAGRALSSLLLAERIPAQKALEWGLAYAVVSQATVLSEAQALAQKLAAGPSSVLSQIRSLQAATFDHSLQQQLRAERCAQDMTLESTECVEGVRAFFEKREPRFEHNS